jgi:chromosome segregation ATPase
MAENTTTVPIDAAELRALQERARLFEANGRRLEGEVRRLETENAALRQTNATLAGQNDAHAEARAASAGAEVQAGQALAELQRQVDDVKASLESERNAHGETKAKLEASEDAQRVARRKYDSLLRGLNETMRTHVEEGG